VLAVGLTAVLVILAILLIWRLFRFFRQVVTRFGRRSSGTEAAPTTP
jgi:predicted neutral ceramidase superfamily lipid hydrolase